MILDKNIFCRGLATCFHALILRVEEGLLDLVKAAADEDAHENRRPDLAQA